MALTREGFDDLKAIVFMVIGALALGVGVVKFVQWEPGEAALAMLLGGFMAGVGLFIWRDNS